VTEPATPRMEIRRLEPQPYACISATTVPREVGATLHRLLSEVGNYLAAKGLQAMGPPLARYYRYDRDMVEMDAGIPVAGGGEGNGAVTIRELPGGDVAVGLHVGPYHTIKQTYDALAAWLAHEGRTPREASWEVYVTDPSTEPDSARWETEIYWPVQP
jgi:effector-binding domain-containing protein